MAIEIKAIPTLEGKDAERFIERADEAELRRCRAFCVNQEWQNNGIS